jgi:adenosine deaminase
MKSIILLGLLVLVSSHGLTAIEIDEVRKLPKAELHLHLGGSYPLSYLKKIASHEEYEALEKGIQQFVDGVEYEQCFFVFGLISKIINTYQRVQEGTYYLCKQLQADGVTYVEIRTGLRDLGSGYEDYLSAVRAGIKKASHDTFQAKILLSVKRTSSRAHAQQTIDLALKYKDHGVIGIDISDNAAQGDITTILPILIEAKKQGLSFVIHMGESPLEKDQMLLLETLQPVRIGHGVYLKPEALAWMKAHKIPLEVCLSSGVCAKMIAQRTAHPGLQRYKEGHPIVICSDDPLICKTTLSQEYVDFAQVANCSFDELRTLIRDSFLHKVH